MKSKPVKFGGLKKMYTKAIMYEPKYLSMYSIHKLLHKGIISLLWE